jgi:hypothetical protein
MTTTEDATAPPREPTQAMLDAANKMFSGIHYPQTLRDIWLTMYDARPTPAPAPVEVDGEPKATAAAEMAAFREWAWNNTETPDAIGNMHGRDAAMYAWMARAKISRHAAAAEITALRERVKDVERERDAEYNLRRNTNALLKDAIARAEAAKADAARLRKWLDNNTTHYNTAERESPVLASVSKRIWYHASDDMESWPFSAAIDAAMSERK